jgi:hypothetical protein
MNKPLWSLPCKTPSEHQKHHVPACESPALAPACDEAEMLDIHPGISIVNPIQNRNISALA